MASKNEGERPSFWIIAGPNGSGKSSLYGSRRGRAYGNTKFLGLTPSFWIINPDLLAQRIRTQERLALPDANLEAVKRIEAWLETSIVALDPDAIPQIKAAISEAKALSMRQRRR
jgi:predicted ABC-type ATPase